MPNGRSSVIGVILAGGLSRRMGGREKSLIVLRGKTLAECVAERLAPQVAGIVLNANGDPSRFASIGLPVIADAHSGNPGPLAGILAGIAWVLGNRPEATHVLSVPADTPFLPADLCERLIAALPSPEAIAVSTSRGQLHPVIGLWPVGLAPELAAALGAGRYKVLDFVTGRPWAAAEFPDIGGFDPFFNINTPQDLAIAEDLLGMPPDNIDPI